MNTAEIAADFTALCKGGKLEEAGHKYWADDVVSIENMEGPMARLEGRSAVQAKTDWWNGAHDIHSVVTEGPFVNGAQFAVTFEMDITNKESGQRMQSKEVGLYTVRDGKIVEERFFYQG